MKYKAILRDNEELDELDLKNSEFKPWMKTAFYFLIVIFTLNFLAIIYINTSREIYFWDDATYWEIARKIASGAMSPGFWSNIYDSIGTEDYNYVAGLLSAVFAKLFGSSRLVYILSLVNLYLIPSFALIYTLCKKISKAPLVSTSITILMMPVLTILTFMGFVDIGGFLMAMVCLNLYYAKKQRWWYFAVIGALLVLSMIWRRWFAFFAVSFVTAMIVDVILCKRKWYYAATAIAVSAFLLVVCFRDFLLYKLLQDYGNMYASYKFSVSTDFKLIMRYFGLVFILAAFVCSIAVGIKKKDLKFIFPWIQMAVCFVMFVSTQTHGQQHLLLYAPGMIAVLLMLINNITKEWALAATILLAVINTANTYIPRTQPSNLQEIKSYALFPNFSMRAEKRDDTYEILSLKTMLDGVVGEGESLGVLSSSFKLNDNILMNAEPSLGLKENRIDYFATLPQVDSRDKDLWPLYNVNYMLVALPAQTHLADGEQTVVTEAVSSFENYTDIATAFEELYDYERQIGDITVKLFKRIREVSEYDIGKFKARLYR